jgi:heme exporter protein D
VNWQSPDDFAQMGGYALYVWGSYIMTAAALAWEALMLTQRRQHATEALRDREARAQVLPRQPFTS